MEPLEIDIIMGTKIHKVWKAAMRMEEIPRDEEFGLKKRMGALYEAWRPQIEAYRQARDAASVQ